MFDLCQTTAGGESEQAAHRDPAPAGYHSSHSTLCIPVAAECVAAPSGYRARLYQMTYLHGRLMSPEERAAGR